LLSHGSTGSRWGAEQSCRSILSRQNFGAFTSFQIIVARELQAKLIRWLEERARAGGFRSIRLATGVKQPEAIALYERLGYVSIPNFSPWENDTRCRCYARILI
jgi:ribosomal protein S18 acetylase RimI-like enzyme